MVQKMSKYYYDFPPGVVMVLVATAACLKIKEAGFKSAFYLEFYDPIYISGNRHSSCCSQLTVCIWCVCWSCYACVGGLPVGGVPPGVGVGPLRSSPSLTTGASREESEHGPFCFIAAVRHSFIVLLPRWMASGACPTNLWKRSSDIYLRFNEARLLSASFLTMTLPPIRRQQLRTIHSARLFIAARQQIIASLGHGKPISRTGNWHCAIVEFSHSVYKYCRNGDFLQRKGCFLSATGGSGAAKHLPTAVVRQEGAKPIAGGYSTVDRVTGYWAVSSLLYRNYNAVVNSAVWVTCFWMTHS